MDAIGCEGRGIVAKQLDQGGGQIAGIGMLDREIVRRFVSNRARADEERAF